MKTYGKILVAIDGSPTAERGLQEAISLATQLGSLLTLVCVVDFYAAVGDMQMAGEQLFEQHFERKCRQANDVLVAAAAQAAANGIQARTVLVSERKPRVADAILGEAAKGHDLLVMGTHGRRGWKRILNGSDAEQVLHETPIPVLLVRADEPLTAHR